MTCTESRDRFTELLDERLASADRVLLERHLATCPECRQELEGLRATLTLLHAVERPRAPIGFVDRVHQAIRPSWPRRLARTLLVPLHRKLPVEAAAILLVGIGVAYVVHRTPEFREAPVPRVERAAPSAERPAETSRAERSVAVERQVQEAHDASTRRKDVTSDPAREPRPAAPPPLRSPVPPMSDAERSAVVQDRAPDGSGAPTLAAPERRSPSVSSPPPEFAARPSAPAAAPATPGAASLARDLATAELRRAAKTSAPDVSGRLAVGDRDEAERGLQRIAAHHGGTLVERREEDGGLVIDVTLGRETYPAFVAELSALGAWTAVQEPPELPDQLRLRILLAR